MCGRIRRLRPSCKDHVGSACRSDGRCRCVQREAHSADRDKLDLVDIACRWRSGSRGKWGAQLWRVGRAWAERERGSRQR